MERTKMDTVKILGIAGSPRHGNTEIAVQEALAAAKTLGDVAPKFVSLAGKKIDSCIGCYRCYADASPQKWCVSLDDDMQEIFDYMLLADGIILGSPVYYGQVAGKCKDLMDRLGPFDHFACSPYRGAMSHKVLGCIACSHTTHGGLEHTINNIHLWGLVCDMIIVGPGTGLPTSCLFGAASSQWPGNRDDEIKSRPNGEALITCRNLGLTVAETTKIIRAGLKAYDHEESWRNWLKKYEPDWMRRQEKNWME